MAIHNLLQIFLILTYSTPLINTTEPRAARWQVSADIGKCMVLQCGIILTNLPTIPGRLWLDMRHLLLLLTLAYVLITSCVFRLQVYEHVYQTVDSVGSQEVCAIATAKATVAAFAASEGQGHPRIVTMEKVRYFPLIE